MASEARSVESTRGYIGIALASVLMAPMGVLAKFAYQYGILPETLIALRLAISSWTLFVILLLLKRGSLRIRRVDLLVFLVFGVFGVAFQRVIFFYAVGLTTATMAILLFYTYPVFVTVVAWFVLKEKVTSSTLLAIVLTFSGVALVVKAYDVSSLRVNFWGITAGLLSGLLFVLYYLVAKKLRSGYTSLTLTLYGDGIGALVLSPALFVSSYSLVLFPLQLWLIVLTIAWIPSLLAYALFSYSLKHVKTSKGSIVNVVEPLSAALFSVVFLGEAFELLQIVGMALALAGVVLLFWMRG